MQINVEGPNTGALIAEADAALALPADYKIDTNHQYIAAADKLKLVKGFAKQWEDQRKELKAPVLEAAKKIDDMFRPAQDRLAAIERTIKTALVAYSDALERARQEEQRRIEAEARKERERIEAEARKAREAAEAKAAELAAKAEAERASGNAREAEKLQAKATAIIDKAADKIETLQSRAATVPTPAAKSQEPPKVSGLNLRTRWYARVTDATLVPREYCVVDEAALNKIAEATKGSIKIPGVEFLVRTEAASARR